MNSKAERIYVKSVSEFIDAVLCKKEVLQPNDAIWFRGEGSEDFPLIPNLYRKTLDHETRTSNILTKTRSIYNIEQNIDGFFYRKATIFFSKSGIRDTPWNRYFLKQHYQVHTRLLDWTENALIALFFALSDSKPEIKSKNAKVILLAPFKLNNYSVPKLLKRPEENYYHILTCGELPMKRKLINKKGQLRDDQLLRKYYRLDCDEGEEMYPISIYPQHLDERMSSQQACFTMYGNVVQGFNIADNTETIIDYVYVASESKVRILNELKLLGINYYTIYPDLDGLGRAINEESSQSFGYSRERDSMDNLLS